MRISFKQGVLCEGVSLRIFEALVVVSQVWDEIATAAWKSPLRETHPIEVVVTSLRDGEHSLRSKHAWNDPCKECEAADIRMWALPDPAAAAAILQVRLGHNYDVILEKDHIHIEWDPK